VGRDGSEPLSLISNAAYMAMIRAFGMTGGASNDIVHEIVAFGRRPKELWGEGIFGPLSGGQGGAVEGLERDGYFVFPELLPVGLCEELSYLAHELPCEVRRRPDIRPARYRDLPSDVSVAWLDESDLAAESLLQRVVGDPGLLGIAQAYLRCRPVMSALAMWWSRAAQASELDRSENAQQFHFDIDRLKWLKFFVYLTDVSAASGPHVFVAGSHRRGGQPRRFMVRGNSRWADHEVIDHFGDRVIELTGPRGTIFVADTRGLHKGKSPVVGTPTASSGLLSGGLLGCP